MAFRFLVLYPDTVPNQPREVLAREGHVRDPKTGRPLYTGWVLSQAMQGLIYNDDEAGIKEFNRVAKEVLGHFKRGIGSPITQVEYVKQPEPTIEEIRALASKKSIRIQELAKEIGSTPEAVRAVVETSEDISITQGGWIKIQAPEPEKIPVPSNEIDPPPVPGAEPPVAESAEGASA